MDWIIDFIEKNPSASATIFATIFATIIAFLFQKGNLDLSREKMEKELFKEFNEKYDKLNDSLEMLNDEMTIEDLKLAKSKIENKTLHNVVIDYFNLSAEQYYWKQKERISDEIWVAWNKGMLEYYKFPVVQQLWKKETIEDNYKSYYLKSGDALFKLYKKPNWIVRSWKRLTK